jgi:serine/threonine protein kinase
MIVDVPEKLGPYRLLRLLGRGGMGEVWLAHDTKLDREVAIKLMRRELMAREDAVKRFYREARAVARLNHPNIVQVYAIGEEGPIIYMVMEYVDGETVSQRLKRLGPLPLKECVNILLQAVEGLGYACARGIIHRDIKPSNMMISSDFRVKIADFGLAKIIEHDSQMTVAGTAIGSPNYMSPEQARGEEADHRSDIYALGISFYQMLTNELPFTGQTPLTVLLRQIQDPLPEPEYLKQLENGRVLEVIKKMTAKNPEDRYQTYGGLAAALAALAPDVRVKPAAHAITSTVPTPQEAEQPAGPPPPSETTGEANLKTHVENKQSPTSDQHATLTVATPLPTRDRNFALILAFAGIVIVALSIFGIVAIMRMQPLTPAVEVHSRPAVAPPMPAAPPSTSPTPVVQAQMSPTAVVPSPTPTPVGFDVAAATKPTPIGPTQGPDAQSAPSPRRVTAAPPPPGLLRENVESPSALPLTPKPAEISRVILGRANAVAGERIPLFLADAPTKQTLDLPAGTRLSFERVLKLSPGGEYYQVVYEGRPYLVRIEDARPEIFGGEASNQSPKGLKVELRIKDASPNEPVPVYADPRGKRVLNRLPAGTILPAEEDPDSIGYRVTLPEGKQGYVFKTMTQPAQ